MHQYANIVEECEVNTRTVIFGVWGILHQVFSTPGEFYTKKSGYFYTIEFYTIFSFFVRKILLFLVQNSPGVEFSWCKNTHFLENSTPGDFYTKTKSGISTPFLFLFLRKESTFFGVEFSWCRNNLVQKTPFLDIKRLLHQIFLQYFSTKLQIIRLNNFFLSYLLIIQKLRPISVSFSWQSILCNFLDNDFD